MLNLKKLGKKFAEYYILGNFAPNYMLYVY